MGEDGMGWDGMGSSHPTRSPGIYYVQVDFVNLSIFSTYVMSQIFCPIRLIIPPVTKVCITFFLFFPLLTKIVFIFVIKSRISCNKIIIFGISVQNFVDLCIVTLIPNMIILLHENLVFMTKIENYG
jgi:hypothetical protein